MHRIYIAVDWNVVSTSFVVIVSGVKELIQRGDFMKAYYDPKKDCVICMEMESWRPKDFTCVDCKKTFRQEVEVLELGVGCFADKSVIKRDNGSLASVPISELTIIEEEV